MHDVVVIGGGPGGYAAAIRAAQLGGKVALVEEAELGGVCVHRGCIPTKVWQKAAEILRSVRSAPQFGIDAEVKSIDFGAIIEQKNKACGKIRMGMEGLLANNKIEVVKGHAAFKTPREIEAAGRRLAAKNFIIATGARLEAPELPNLKAALLSVEAVHEMRAVPASVLVVGAESVDVEIAALLNSFGAKVLLAADGRRILPQEDGDSSQRLEQALRESGIDILNRATLASVAPAADGRFACALAGPKAKTVEVERVFICRRRPNSDRLGLEKAGVAVAAEGFIQVDERLKTSTAGIYAIGDVAGGSLQSHGASAMGVCAAENAMGRKVDFPAHLVPRGTWTSPEVASVGMTEEAAEKLGLEVETGYFPYSINGMALARNEPSGAVKVVTDVNYRTIYGVHIVGPHATELIGEAALAMQLEYTTAEFAAGIRVHPTFSEALVDAARDAEKWALYLPKR
jgi:dihydrolipoamide dehydrogenase